MTTTNTPRRLSLRLPLPPTILRPNAAARAHPGAVRTAKREYGRTVAWCIREQCGVPPYRPFRHAQLTLTAVFVSGRGVWDDDAVVAAFKSGRDQFKSSGLVPDDDPAHLTLGGVTTILSRVERQPYLLADLTEVGDGRAPPAT